MDSQYLAERNTSTFSKPVNLEVFFLHWAKGQDCAYSSTLVTWLSFPATEHMFQNPNMSSTNTYHVLIYLHLLFCLIQCVYPQTIFWPPKCFFFFFRHTIFVSSREKLCVLLYPLPAGDLIASLHPQKPYLLRLVWISKLEHLHSSFILFSNKHLFPVPVTLGLLLVTICLSTKRWVSGHLYFLFTPLSLAHDK